MLEEILQQAMQQRASDVHLHIGSPPMLRLHGELVTPPGFAVLTPDDLKNAADRILRPEQKERFASGEEIDTSFSVPHVGRFRTNVFRQRGSLGIVLRRVNSEIPTVTDLNLPPAVASLTRFHAGLVLVTGVTGSGKSSTLASIIDLLNEERCAHIVTIEDPIEYLYQNKRSIITQREIGQDTLDFAHALKAVLRQDPDVILIGEMRDAETIKAAITAAETGHLVLSTLHTTTAPQTIERILEYFSEDMRPVLRQQIAFHLRAVISQRLVPRLDGQGMLPAVELLFMNPLVRKLILESKMGLIKSIIHNAGNEGMQTFDQHLVALYNAGLVSYEEAQIASSNPDAFHMFCQGFFSDIVQGIYDV